MVLIGGPFALSWKTLLNLLKENRKFENILRGQHETHRHLKVWKWKQVKVFYRNYRESTTTCPVCGCSKTKLNNKITLTGTGAYYLSAEGRHKEFNSFKLPKFDILFQIPCIFLCISLSKTPAP